MFANFDKIKSMNIDELSEWLDMYGQIDNSPWIKWWNETYCKSCPSEIGYVVDDTGRNQWNIPYECTWCELHGKCKFFQELKDLPDNKEIIEMWLENEYE